MPKCRVVLSFEIDVRDDSHYKLLEQNLSRDLTSYDKLRYEVAVAEGKGCPFVEMFPSASNFQIQAVSDLK